MNLQTNIDMNEGQTFELDSNNYLSLMVEEYETEKEKISNFLSQFKTISVGMPKWEDLIGITFKDIESEDYALKGLKAVFWARIFERSNIRTFLSSDAVNEWVSMFSLKKINSADYKELPDFTYETVVSTVQGWFDSLDSLFADRVDSVFSKLSYGHLTNHPNGFNRKLIFTYACEVAYNNFNVASVRSAFQSSFHDLRSIIAVAHDLPIPDYGSNYDATNRLAFGVKHDFDSGLLTVQAFKNGNMHVWIDPETAVLLNSHLAKKYPNILSTADMPKRKKNKKTFSYETASIGSEFKRFIQSVADRDSSVISANQNLKDDFDKYFGITVDAYCDSDLDLSSTVAAIVKTGLPSVKSYQFYPSPEAITSCIADHIGIVGEDQKFLEPSAGSGAIAQLYPKNFVCFEVYKPFVELLTAKGIQAKEADFLAQVGDFSFDKVVMNPPYSFKRCLMHFDHAFSFIHSEGEIYIVAPTGLKSALEQVANKHSRTLTELQPFAPIFSDTDIKTSLFLAS